MSSVIVEGVTKAFGSTTVLDDVSLEVKDTEFVTLLGPSGSGKTTLLRIIAGLIKPDLGEVFFGGRSVTRLPPDKRNIAMVFQDYALYPNMRVRDNIGFCLKLQKMGRADIDQRVKAVSQTLGIESYLDRWPHELSGGQKQRVALGRAMVRKPEVFLLDEPLSNLDAQLRIAMRAELQRIHANLRGTMIHVTHDQEEALSVSQRVAVISNGRVEQYGAPEDLYGKPTSVSVARFIGIPPINLLPCKLVANGECWSVTGNSFSLQVPLGCIAPASSSNVDDVLLGIRPEDLTVTSDASTGIWRGEVTVVERLGKETVAYLATAHERELIVQVGKGSPVHVGQSLAVTAQPEDLHFFDGRSGAALRT